MFERLSQEGKKDVHTLIRTLADDDGWAREEAREALVALGKPAVAPLIAALSAPNDHMRWEATKALKEIADPTAASALVKALEDENGGTRWLAAEGLIAIGLAGLPPLLQTLAEHPQSAWLRDGTHHVLHALSEMGYRDEVAPVLKALESIDPTTEIPEAVDTVLRRLAQSADLNTGEKAGDGH
ncbi:MAG: HEAT repeat domain-containing protein [Chloroflexi bacterium]|nr:HEAT repeat domain-containing protein [Chloroflexota bacterium]